MTAKEMYQLIVNKKEKSWGEQFTTGSEIKNLAESPADWVVNQVVPGPGEDPEIKDSERVNLAKDAPPNGIKKFTTRKPTTSPGTARQSS